VGSRDIVFVPGHDEPRHRYEWDIGSAGSTGALALAILPVLVARAGAGVATEVELRGGVFQDYAPSAFHLQHVLLRLLETMGADARLELVRPGYVPKGDGVLRLVVNASGRPLAPLVLEERCAVERIWGIALSSHLARRQVTARMADAARERLAAAGYNADIDEREDSAAAQPGASLAVFADRGSHIRLGADRAGAPRRPAEAIGRTVADMLVAELDADSTVDRFAADQLIPFAAIAGGETRVRVLESSDHVDSGAWLAELFLDAEVTVDGNLLVVRGRSS